MRKALYGILMAAAAGTVVSPALAQDKYERAKARYERQAERNQARSEARSEARVERQQVRTEARVERQQVERPQVDRLQVDRSAIRAERQAQREAFGVGTGAADREQRLERREDRLERREDRAQNRVEQIDNRQQRVDNRQERLGNRQERAGTRRDGNIYEDREAFRDRIRETRDASQRSADQTIGGRYERQAERNQHRYERELREDRREYRQDRRERRWSRDWRRDSRYDWYGYRNRYRDYYRVGRYYDPYGYGYRRFSIGFRINTGFYGSRYVIHDPWRYRLPQPYPGYVWVRYYNDVLLVDTYTGEVEDVIYNFFW